MLSAKGWERLLSGIIDRIIFTIISFLAIYLLKHDTLVAASQSFINNFKFSNLYELFIQYCSDISNFECFIIFVVVLLIYSLFFIFIPIITNGKTIGSIIFGIRIVKLSETKISFGTMFLRQIIASFIVPILTLQIVNIFNIVFLFTAKGRRTVPDRMSNTLIVKDVDKLKIRI